jgi:hypothetical protein
VRNGALSASRPATEQTGEVLLARLLAAPFTLTEDRVTHPGT